MASQNPLYVSYPVAAFNGVKHSQAISQNTPVVNPYAITDSDIIFSKILIKNATSKKTEIKLESGTTQYLTQVNDTDNLYKIGINIPSVVTNDSVMTLSKDAVLTLKNSLGGSPKLQFYNSSNIGVNLEYNNLEGRFKINKSDGVQLLTINANGEGSLGILAPRSGYSLNLNQGVYIAESGDHLYLEGTDSLTSYKTEMKFKSNTNIGTIKHDTTGFSLDRPCTLNAGLTISGLATFNNGTIISGNATFANGVSISSLTVTNSLIVRSAATFNTNVTIGGTTTHNGTTLFNNWTTFNSTAVINSGFQTNTGLQIIPMDIGKMVYKNFYGSTTNDIYGIGQYYGGKMRLFCSTSGDTWNFCSNLGCVVNDSAGQYIDQIRTQYGRVAMLTFQDMTPSMVFSLPGAYKWTEPVPSDASLRIMHQANNVNWSNYYKTFETIVQNIGKADSYVAECNYWSQIVRSLTRGGNSTIGTFQTNLGTMYYPPYEGYNYTYNDMWAPHFYISHTSSNYGDRVAMRLYFQQNNVGYNNGGWNTSNVCFPQLARGSFINAFIDPYGFLYPDQYPSDNRLKKNIIKQDRPILEEFKKINVVNFNWDYTGEHSDYCNQQPRTLTDEEQIGVIAQNLEELPTIKEKYKLVDTYQFSPELPTGKNEKPWDKSKSNFKPTKEFFILNKERIPFLNMKAIQEVSAQVDTLKLEVSRLNELSSASLRENTVLKNELTTVKTQLNDLITLLKSKSII